MKITNTKGISTMTTVRQEHPLAVEGFEKMRIFRIHWDKYHVQSGEEVFVRQEIDGKWHTSAWCTQDFTATSANRIADEYAIHLIEMAAEKATLAWAEHATVWGTEGNPRQGGAPSPYWTGPLQVDIPLGQKDFKEWFAHWLVGNE